MKKDTVGKRLDMKDLKICVCMFRSIGPHTANRSTKGGYLVSTKSFATNLLPYEKADVVQKHEV